MGRLACETVRAAPDLDYAGGFARSADPSQWIDDDFGRLLRERKPEVVVDFTTMPVSADLATQAVIAGVAPIVGATGWSEAECTALGDLARERGIGAMLVPNFAIGAVLMMRFAEQAARHFPTAEIVELHHDQKRDKPSGTAKLTAERITAGGGPAHVPVHSVRLRGLVAHQEVLFGGAGEVLTLRHDSLSRESFAAGILFAIRSIGELRGLVVGLDAILDRSVKGNA